MTDIRPSLFLLTGVLLSPPQFPSLLGGGRASESRCLVCMEPGRGGLGQRADHLDLCEAWQIIATPSREALCGDWNGHGPQTMPTFWTVLNGCTEQVGVSEPWIFSRYLTSGLLCSSFGQMNSSDVPAKELCPEPGSLWIHLPLMGQPYSLAFPRQAQREVRACPSSHSQSGLRQPWISRPCPIK